eukprot:GFYU01003712.1.p1 GENE.GFYU01003712.1~~GFYU01003712.1.p1  ORF type:complete len:262 (-),score=68.20 GFYU01003712.1:253-987(-)
MGKRTDNRGPDDMRPIHMRVGVISQATGSAYVEIDRTKVIVGIYGPRQKKHMEYSEVGTIECDLKFASFAGETRRQQTQTAADKEMSAALRDALQGAVRVETFPKAVVDVYALVLENDGGALAAAVTCASLAMADAGIEMFDLVSSCSVAQLGEDEVVLDPSRKEEEGQLCGMTVSYLPTLREITHVTQQGEMAPPKHVEATELCIDGCSKIHDLLKVALNKALKKKIKVNEKKRKSMMTAGDE